MTGNGVELFIFWSVIALLVFAAIYDALYFKIPNVVSGVLILLFVPAAIASPGAVPFWWHVLCAVAVLLVGLIAFQYNVMGAGDVKLLVAISLWAVPQNLPMVLLLVAAAGGVLAIALIILRRLLALTSFTPLRRVRLPRVLVPRNPLPYGLAIAAGGLWMMARDLSYLGPVAAV